MPSPGHPAHLPRLVASDLDGTLVRSDGTIDTRTCEVLRRLETAGVLVVFVTGRPPRWMAHVAADTGHTGLAICANGALLYDLHNETIVAERLIDIDTLHWVVERLRAVFPEMVFAIEYGLDFAHEPGYVHEYDIGVPDLRIAHCPRILDQPAAKLLGRVDSLDPDTVLAKAVELVGDRVTLTHASTVALLEISALGVSKAAALAELAAWHRIAASEVLAFGDMPNDLGMLTWAGRSVAVANAHPEVLLAADEVTASNDDSGVAQVLERLFTR